MMNSASKTDLDNCHSFLVRMWRDGPHEPWRASVKTVSGGREIHFVSPEKLFLFLHGQLDGGGIDSDDAAGNDGAGQPDSD
jgi:hypothetical protein